MENKPEIRKQDLINLNSICTAKETLKERPSEEEKYWQTKIPTSIKNTNNIPAVGERGDVVGEG